MRVFLIYNLLFGALGLISSCAKEYSIEGRPVAVGYLVKDNSGNCSLTTVSGTFYLGKNLGDTNFLLVQVHINKPGSFSITSPVLNGYSFHLSGEFTDTGTHQVKIPAEGKPLQTGANIFSLRFDTSYCEATVTVLDTLLNVVQTTNPEHFPLASNNRWSYDDLTFPGDSVVRSTTGTATQNGAPHWKMNDYISFYPANNARYFSRTGNDYFQYADVSSFTSYVEFSPTIYDDVNFLKEGIKTGDSWTSNQWTGHISLGIEIMSLQLQYTCLDADAVLTVNNKTFVHVYKVKMVPMLAQQGHPLVPTGEVTTAWFAKGVGLIYSERFNTVLTHGELRLKSWIVN